MKLATKLTSLGAVLLGVSVLSACGSTGAPDAAPTPTTTVTASATPSSTVPAAVTWPTDTPVPKGLTPTGGTNPANRMYYGKGTLDSVSSGLLDQFVAAGYEVQEGGNVSEDGVVINFVKGDVKILMVVAGKGKFVTCALSLSSA